MMNNFNRKKTFYAGLILLSFFAVLLRVHIIVIERGRPIVSLTGEWERSGKPVMVKTIEPADVSLYTKFTVVSSAEKAASGFVTAGLKDSLEAGEKIYFTPEAEACGVVLSVNNELDINTGMFAVKVGFEEPRKKTGEILVVFALSQSLQDVLAVPNEALGPEEGVFYLWVVKNERAQKKQVEVGPQSINQSVILSGIEAGDCVVLSGQIWLEENDAVNIVGG